MIKEQLQYKPLLIVVLAYLTLLMLGLGVPSAIAAPAAELEPFWDDREDESKMLVDHSAWQSFLTKYLDDRHPSGINRLDYSEVGTGDVSAIEVYLQYLQSLDPRQLNTLEQKAYWINLYNASTVRLILEQDKSLKSIRQIRSGFFTPGPWQRKILTITLQNLSLDDIEHRILRPIWKDNRIHYAVNCASLGCPNLLKTAFTGANVEVLLDKAARDFINHPRAVARINGELMLSEIYNWYAEDFGTGPEGLKAHLKEYATPETIALLESFNAPKFEYDWALNRP